jgi:hypothetical protein
MFTSLYGHFEIVKLLIENNADVNIQEKVFFILILNFYFCIYFLIFFAIIFVNFILLIIFIIFLEWKYSITDGFKKRLL